MHHGKHHRRNTLFFFYLVGFFFYVVGAVKNFSLTCRGAWGLCAVLVQLSKVCIDVGSCFVSYGLLLLFDQTLLCEIIVIPNLGDVNADFLIATGYNVPGFDLLGEVIKILAIFFYVWCGIPWCIVTVFSLDFSNVVIFMHVLSRMCCIIFFGVTPLYPKYRFLIATTASSPTP